MKAVRLLSEEDPGGGVKLVQWMSVVGLIAVFGILYVWEQVQTRDLKRDMLQLESRKSKLIEENTRLQVQVVRLSGQDVVQPLAADLFQLDYPAIGQVITVPDRGLAADGQMPTVPARTTIPSSARPITSW